MPAGEEFLSADLRNTTGAILMLGAATNAYDAFSAVMSSPWSTEKFSQGSEEQAMARTYVRHAIVISAAYAGASALLARSLWPIIGAAGVSAYLYWLYQRALSRAADAEAHGADLSGAKNGDAAQASAQRVTQPVWPGGA